MASLGGFLPVPCLLAQKTTSLWSTFRGEKGGPEYNASYIRARKARPARWTCAKAHPYGNGGLMNVCNYDGYDREATLATFEKVKAEFDAILAARGNDDGMSMWAVISNTDAIMWKNNLMDAAVELGLEMDLSKVRIVRVVEEIAPMCFDDHFDHMWVLGCSNTDALLSVTHDKHGKMALAWEKQEDANSFAMHLEADGRGRTTPHRMPLEDLKSLCKSQDSLIGFVLPSMVLPSHFPHGSV
jgi:hypothetical protein